MRHNVILGAVTGADNSSTGKPGRASTSPGRSLTVLTTVRGESPSVRCGHLTAIGFGNRSQVRRRLLSVPKSFSEREGELSYTRAAKRRTRSEGKEKGRYG